MLSSEISHAPRFIADPSKRLIDMITPPIANIDIAAFSPPVEKGTEAVPRVPEVHFQTFVEVLVAVIQQGQAESKGGVSQGRRDLLINESQKMSKTLREYRILIKTHSCRGRRGCGSALFSRSTETSITFSDWCSTPRYL